MKMRLVVYALFGVLGMASQAQAACECRCVNGQDHEMAEVGGINCLRVVVRRCYSPQLFAKKI